MKMIKLCLIQIGICGLLLLFPILNYWNLLPSKTYYAKDFGFSEYISPCDADQDGLDDSHDLLLGARSYVESGLKYKSAYYDGGYPTDEYSVCTDVIWNAFHAAGYSLKDLIDKDILLNYQVYSIETPDSNIDFRRVRNLKIFFERYAISLTTDLSDISQWQPGDIVTFAPSHIGIISDKRNKDGIPFLIHHGRQPKKEEDCLIKRNMQITGHFRWR